jgi:hypothetical protein
MELLERGKEYYYLNVMNAATEMKICPKSIREKCSTYEENGK